MATPRSAAAATTRSPRFHADGGTLFGIMFVNALLTICTLGIYYFWGKAKLQRYIYQQIEIDGDRFDFHGTGREMFMGWLKVMGLVVATVLMAGAATFASITIFGKRSIVPQLIMAGVYLVMIALMPFIIVGARRYLLSRISWRGLRFAFRGDAQQFVGPFIGGMFLTFLTLGFYAPYFLHNVYGFLMGNSYYGDRRFEYDGNPKELFSMYVRAFFLGIVTFGIYWVFYAAQRAQYLAAHTRFGNVRFRATFTGVDLLVLAITNVLLTLVTLGFALPWVMVRTTRFYFEHFVLDGAIDMAGIGPGPSATTADDVTFAEAAGVLGV